MINLYLRFGVALHVALMVIYSSWARGGSSPYYLWALPWLALGVIEIMFLMPPMGKKDTPRVATLRLIRNIFLDPVTYLGLFLIGYLIIQWMNGPCELVEDSTVLVGWKYTDPPWPSMPFCADRALASQVLIWFIAVVTAVIAVRHAMKPSARYFILKLFAANGALLSVLGFLQAITCPGKLFWFREMPVYFFSTFGYPNHAGTFFMMTTALSMGLLIRALGDTENRRGAPWLVIAFFLNAAGIYGSLSRTAILLGTAMIAVGFIYGIIYLWRKIPKLQIFAALIAAAVLAIVITVFAVTPGSPLKKELDTIDFSGNIAEAVYQGDRRDLADAALAIWQDHPWTGVGGWGFINYVGLYMPEEKWEYLKSAGRANVHNDPLQFLCEHGMIGAGLIAAIIIVLLVHAFIRLGNVKRVVDPQTGRPSSWGASVSPCVWAVFAATGAMLVHSTLDLPFRSIANTLIWFICLACLPGFIPQESKAAANTVDAQDMPSASNRDTGGAHHHHHSNDREHYHHREEVPDNAVSSADVPDSPSAETGASEQ